MMKPRVSARGQTLVEYALILPLMLMILVMLFDLGRAVYYYSVIHNAAREGARYGIIFPDNTAAIELEARSRAVGLNPDDLTIVSVHNHPTGSTINKIEVTVVYIFDPVTPFVEDLLGGSIELTSRSTMNVEG